MGVTAMGFAEDFGQSVVLKFWTLKKQKDRPGKLAWIIVDDLIEKNINHMLDNYE